MRNVYLSSAVGNQPANPWKEILEPTSDFHGLRVAPMVSQNREKTATALLDSSLGIKDAKSSKKQINGMPKKPAA